MAEKILMNEYKALAKEPWAHVELWHDDIFHWRIGLLVLNPDSLYHGGYFLADMTFPQTYPFAPPQFKFLRPLYHPNIFPDGRLCISILHAPGDDELSGELAAERWSPAQRVESVLVSIISLLDDAECSSPANVDAGVMLRKQPEEYRRRVHADVEASKADIPDGFVMPDQATTVHQPEKPIEDRDFWYDSDQDHDFGGSDTDLVEDGEDDGDGEEEEDEDER